MDHYTMTCYINVFIKNCFFTLILRDVKIIALTVVFACDIFACFVRESGPSTYLLFRESHSIAEVSCVTGVEIKNTQQKVCCQISFYSLYFEVVLCQSVIHHGLFQTSPKSNVFIFMNLPSGNSWSINNAIKVNIFSRLT